MIGAEPSKETPLMLRAVASLVAVLAFPFNEAVRVPRKVLFPVKVLISASKVVEATVMFEVPSKATPLIFRAVASLVALPASPEKLPPTLVKLAIPEYVLLSVRAVELAAVMVIFDEPLNDVPFIVLAF